MCDFEYSKFFRYQSLSKRSPDVMLFAIRLSTSRSVQIFDQLWFRRLDRDEEISVEAVAISAA
jgi:hypothetical protein